MSKKPNRSRDQSHNDWLTGGGEMGRLIREMDWSQTALGPIESWPQSLRSSVSMLLPSKAQIILFWGPKLIAIYNDAYIEIFGTKHPWALGKPARKCWSEIWEVLGPLFEGVVSAGEAFWANDHPFSLERQGYTEETYFDVSYDPVRDETGKVGGVFCIVRETTRRVLGERRLHTLRHLAAHSAEARTEEEACRLAAETLAANAYDIPFALIYLLDHAAGRAQLAGAAGIAVDTVATPRDIPFLGAGDSLPGWPFAEVLADRRMRVVSDLSERFGLIGAKLPGGPWPEPSEQAVILPLARSGQEQTSISLAGFLIAGVSPRRAFDDEYKGFFALVAGQVTTAIARAHAYEEERQRAEALAEIDRAKTAFFSNVSHEFRTPLTLMLGPIEDTLAEGQLTSQARERLEVAHRNSLRLLKLVNTLLDFSRLEAGRIEAVYEPIDLAIFTADLASVFRSAIERAGMSLIIDCPPLPRDTYVDREMWEKIVLNLLSNAFKFTFEGQIEVNLKPAGESVELTVRDTGVGIAAKDLLQLFDRFHRIEGARGRTYEGSGIGLALVQELVKLHGGTARVESEVGIGSAFIVSIPFGKNHLPADRIGATRTLASTSLQGEGYIEEALRWIPEIQNSERGIRNEGRLESAVDSAQSIPLSTFGVPHSKILLADDNADMREYVRRLLSAQYEVVTVADGKEALKAAREIAFDLILSDVMMPRLDGFGLLRELRQDERTRDIPVILLSARAGEESKAEGLEGGANDYLVKPFSARELLARVGARLQLQQARRESQAALRASERKFSAAFNQSPLPMTITSLDDGRLTDVNESFEQLSGYMREEALGRTPEELRLLAEWGRRDEGRKLLQAGERVYGFEARFLTKSGEERIGLIRSSLIEINSRPHVLSSFTDITEHKQAEEAISRLAAIVESSDDAIVSKDLNGVIMSWNEGAEKLFGYTAEDVIGKPIMILIPPDRADEESRVLESIRRGEKIDHYETVRRRKDGALAEISLTISPIRDRAGKVIGASKIARDITERKRVELALAEGARQQRALYLLADQLHRAQSLDDVYNAALDAILSALRCERASILLFDEAGVMRFVGWRGLSEEYRKAVEGHSPWKPDDKYPEPICINDIDLAEIDDSLKAVVKREGISALTFVPLVSRGKLIGKFMTYFNDIHAFSDDEIGLSLTIARGLAFGIDRKRSEDLLRQYAAQLALITNNAPVLIAQCDAQSRFKFVNKAYAERFGLTPEDCVGKRILEVTGEEAYQSFSQHIAAVLRGEPVEFEVEIPYAVIGKHFMHCSYAPESDATGKVVGFVAAITDITERKRAEEEIARLLAEEQAARELAEQATRAKDEFLAVVSHELRSPLNAILGWNSMLGSKRGDDPYIARVIETIERNGKAQLQLIEDLLDTARIISGNMKLEFQPVDPVAVIGAALDTVRTAASSKGIVITTDIDPKAGQFTGDHARLQQVVWNLVSNAVKFTPEGGRVWVELRRGGAGVQIIVRDTGQGIEPDLAPYVFDRFRQGDSSTSRRFGGLGLGLSLVKHLVELHGGDVKIESPGKGQGTTVTVSLPVRAIQSQGQTEPRGDWGQPVIRRSPSKILKGVRALVVDDEADARELITLTLEQNGAQVASVDSAAAALDALESRLDGNSAGEPFEILICDIGMPGTDGYELIRQIRAHKNDRVSSIKTVALTAYARSENRLQALRAGFHMYVSKPVDEAELTAVIGALTGHIPEQSPIAEVAEDLEKSQKS